MSLTDLWRLALCLLSLHLFQRWKHPIGSSRMANSDPSQQVCLSGPARHCVSVSVSVSVCVCEMAWQTREWWTRSDMRPLKQPRINGLNRQAPLEGCGRVMRTSTSHSAPIHLPFRIYALLQLEIPDVEPPVEKRGHENPATGEEESSKTPLPWWLFKVNSFESGAPLVVWAAMAFRWAWPRLVVWQFTRKTGGASATRHCRDSSQGPEENQTWRLPLGYSDIWTYERLWKGSNNNWEVEAAALSMSHLHETTRYF